MPRSLKWGEFGIGPHLIVTPMTLDSTSINRKTQKLTGPGR